MKQLSEFISPMQERWLLEKAEPYMFNWFVDILNLEQDRRKMPSFLNKYCYKEEHEYNPTELRVYIDIDTTISFYKLSYNLNVF